ncbi:CD36 family [Nesidiocoris tenuis]|uniref:Sensory neuron membrane protein 2 n=1 Tax=Nesidiocoris tenuis TaxID=355587 RepID=A0ABN7B671_9HEMI|nr:CD36 family [Nesidiocoris tenuis]
MRKCYNWLFVAGAGVLVVVGILIFHYAILPIIVHKQVAETLQLNNGTDAWDRFVNLPVPLYFRVYIFNLINPDAVARGEKAIVKEVGPYVYKETREKFNLQLFDDNDTVRYEERTKFEFDAKLSHPLTEDDYIQPTNPTAPIVYSIVERLPEVSFLSELLDPGFKAMFGDRYGLTLNVTVRQLLFDGVEAKCPPNGTIVNRLVCSAIHNFPLVKVGRRLPNGDLSIAILRFKNETSGGVFEIYRGNHDFEKIGMITSINGAPTVDNWPGERCNLVSGTYAESLIKPFLTMDSKFSFYDDDACTASPMSGDSEETVEGIDCLKFTPASSFLSPVTDHPENYCYCPGSIGGLTQGTACLKKGVMDISPCQGT